MCFTLNNYNENDVARIHGIQCSYVITGFETAPATGTKHIQDYIRFSSPRQFAWVKAKLRTTAHIERARGTEEQNRTYCSKSGTFKESGEFRAESGSQGRRNDLKTAYDAYVSEILKKCFDIAPGTCIRDHKHITEVARRIRAKENAMVRRIPGAYRQWQHDFILAIQTRNQRCIYWVYDLVGNSGKSLLSSDLVATYGALRLENCKTADAAYAYNGQRIVTFDFSRCIVEVINYGLIESGKLQPNIITTYVHYELSKDKNQI